MGFCFSCCIPPPPPPPPQPSTQHHHQHTITTSPSTQHHEHNTISTTPSTQHAAAEAARIQKTSKRAAILQSSQQSWHLLPRAYQYFVISACSYGWVARLPTLTTNKQSLRMFGRVTGFQQRMASFPLRQILLGGHLDVHLRSVSNLVRRTSRMLQQGRIALHNRETVPQQLRVCSDAFWSWKVGSPLDRGIFSTLQTMALCLSKEWIVAKLLTLEKIFMHCVHNARHEVDEAWKGLNPLICIVSLTWSI